MSPPTRQELNRQTDRSLVGIVRKKRAPLLLKGRSNFGGTNQSLRITSEKKLLLFAFVKTHGSLCTPIDEL